MKSILKYIPAVALAFAATSCIEEIEPQSGTVSSDQASSAPGAYDNFVSTITGDLCGQFKHSGSADARPYDCGYPAFMLMRDIQGCDMAEPYLNWFSNWYQGQYGGPTYVYAQLPWTYYYSWIKNCNTVLALAGEEPAAEYQAGAAIAYTMRALFYEELAQMYAQQTYLQNPEAETVPYVSQTTSIEELAYNKRKTNAEMWDLILEDLNKAEALYKACNFERKDKYTPDLSVALGLKARAYLIMGKWDEAATAAEQALAAGPDGSYKALSPAQYTDRTNGFNNPNNDSWMFACQYKGSDDNITYNDADSNWPSMMCLEVDPEVSGCGYASNYGQLFIMDRHLYESMPTTDCRRQCFVDYALDEMSEDEQLQALKDNYTDYPASVWNSGMAASEYGALGGLSLKFRLAGGAAGRLNQYIGFCISIPMMRAEEMQLIIIEAKGRKNEADGETLLTQWVKENRDPSFRYGLHNEKYGNASTSAFVNEVWWQRRVEFWGEGIATFDIKRLDKGIIRAYEGTSHAETARFNIGDYNTNKGNNHPDWMDLCIVQTETNYNFECSNNPTPIAPTQDSQNWDKEW